MQERGLLYVGDDESYFAHATSLAFFQFPNYSKEYFTVGGQYPMHSIGPGIMAFPFVFSFSLIDRLQHSPIVDERNITNIIDSWTLFGFIISTIFYFYFGVVLLYKVLNFYFEKRISFFAILFMVLFQFSPLYIFRRPILSHIYEFFLQSVLIYVLAKDSKTKFLDNAKWWVAIALGVIVGLITLVRYNNILFSLLWPVVIFCFRDNKFNFRKHIKRLIITYITAFIFIFIFKLLLNIIYGYEAYGSFFSNSLLIMFQPDSIIYYLKSTLYIFFGTVWGFIYTAPFLIVGLFWSFYSKYDLKKQILIMLIPVLVNFFIYFMGSEGWYGYRLIFFSIVPILIIPFADFLNKGTLKLNFKILTMILFIIAIIPVISMLSYEGIIKMPVDGYNANVVNYYHLDLLKTIFINPKGLLTSLLKGGPLYIIYLLVQTFNLNKFLPAIITDKYPFLNAKILIKTVIIYIFPFILYFLYILINKIRDRKLLNVD